MLRPPEAQVTVRVAPDVEALRILEHGLVTVGRHVEERQALAPLHLHPTELDVACHRALHVVDRRAPSDHLFDRGLQQRAVVAEALELIGVVGEGLERTGERVPGGVVAGGEHDQVVAERLEHAEGLTVVEGGGGECRRQVVAGVGAYGPR